MDTKIAGLNHLLIEQTFTQAYERRMFILERIIEVLDEPRAELSLFAPRIQAVMIDPAKTSELIGPGVKINRIIPEPGGKEVISIDIEYDRTVMVSSTDSKPAIWAISQIVGIGRLIEVGEIFEGMVVQIIKDRINLEKEIGAVVQFVSNKDGMACISQVSNERNAKVSDVLKIGDIVKVNIAAIDPDKGCYSLTMKDL